MNTIVRALNLSHFLQFIVLGIFDELGDELEEMSIRVDLFYDLIEKYRILDVNKFL